MTTLTAADKPGIYECRGTMSGSCYFLRWDGNKLRKADGGTQRLEWFTNFIGPYVLAPQPETGGTP